MKRLQRLGREGECPRAACPEWGQGTGKRKNRHVLALENASDRLTSHTATERDDRKDMSLRENSQVDIR